jgi:hypothetical protein
MPGLLYASNGAAALRQRPEDALAVFHGPRFSAPIGPFDLVFSDDSAEPGAKACDASSMGSLRCSVCARQGSRPLVEGMGRVRLPSSIELDT